MNNTANQDIELRIRVLTLRLIIDILMLIVVIVNIVYLIFDWSFSFAIFQDLVKGVSESFYLNYRDEIHPNFVYYESFFVSIFLVEVIVQWIISIFLKRYVKWWLYPVVHWYDVLGCIPLGYFVWLRFFRIFTMTYRLHKRGVIDLKKSVIYRQFYGVYEIFVHDASDRALMELIESLQREVKNESSGDLLTYSVKPVQAELALALTTKIHEVIDSNYTLHRDDMRQQIQDVIRDGFENSKEIEKLENLPLIGNKIADRVEKLVSDVSVQLADSLTSKLASEEIAQLLENILNTSIDALLKEEEELQPEKEVDKQLNAILSDIADRMLQRLKDDIDNKRKDRMKIFKPED
ncbi:MAG: hypothetical protein R2780_15120 [Crocinitomicaceae bacterium]|nr:hypothetical protein [Crocinitomicaceae bacterium]